MPSFSHHTDSAESPPAPVEPNGAPLSERIAPGKDEAAVLKALRTNTAFFQKEVAGKLRLKYAARIKFLPDESFDEASRIDSLLDDPRVKRDLGED